jgi:ribosome maturation factor RimP
MKLEEKINELLGSHLDGTALFLVEIKIQQGKNVVVTLDCDSGITIDQCEQVSRWLLKQLDSLMTFSEQYSLEVGSPGLDQPLKLVRQYRKSKGRSVLVRMSTNETREGILLYADEEKIILEQAEQKKGSEPLRRQIEIPFQLIQSTQLIVSFN